MPGIAPPKRAMSAPWTSFLFQRTPRSERSRRKDDRARGTRCGRNPSSPWDRSAEAKGPGTSLSGAEVRGGTDPR